jgi:tight adherence protein B
MTTILVWLLVVLIGDRLRLRAPRRCPYRPADPDLDDRDRPPVQRRHLPPIRLRARSAGRPPAPEHVAAWCDHLAGAVRGGSTLTAAIHEVEPAASVATTVAAIRLAVQRGAPLREACAIEHCPAHLDVALTVIRACAAHGGPAAEPLSRTAATLRGRAADAAERRTQSAQARMSAIVMTVLPVCMLGLLLVTSGSVRTFAGSPLGLAVIATGAASNALGWRWMRHLIDGGHR